MKHRQYWLRAVEYGGRGLDTRMADLLTRYRDWLLEEAIPAGGLGPEEAARVEVRHIADSLLFASELPLGVTEVWDLGSGAGLPGVPLAIVMPDTEFLLIDRSGGRLDLLKRGLRVLGLGNVTVQLTELERLKGSTEAMVSRAAMSPAQLGPLARNHLDPGGIVVVGGSWTGPPREPGWETRPIPHGILDHDVWLLIMRRQ